MRGLGLGGSQINILHVGCFSSYFTVMAITLSRFFFSREGAEFVLCA